MNGRDSAGHRRALDDAFEAAEQGSTYSFRRTFTDADVALFCGVTQDHNPYHQDELFARETRFGARILPGLLAASMVTHLGGLMSLLATEMHFEFLAPVYIGDTITCTLRIEAKEARRLVCSATLVNQDGVQVTRARCLGLPGPNRLG